MVQPKSMVNDQTTGCHYYLCQKPSNLFLEKFIGLKEFSDWNPRRVNNFCPLFLSAFVNSFLFKISHDSKCSLISKMSLAFNPILNIVLFNILQQQILRLFVALVPFVYLVIIVKLFAFDWPDTGQLHGRYHPFRKFYKIQIIARARFN